MRLTEIRRGTTVTVTAVGGHHHIHERLSEMGFVPGREVTLLYKAPTGTPLVFSVMGTEVALRRDEAANVLTDTPLQSEDHILSHDDLISSVRASAHRINRINHIPNACAACGHRSACQSCPQRRDAAKPQGEKKQLTVALIGNPNCGKTSLFNALCGAHEHTGNYSGVTVHSIEGRRRHKGASLRVIDLPGTYSLHAFSPEEAYVARELDRGHIDVIVNVLDVNSLERNLLLTMQTRMMGIPMIGALNMYDEFRGSGSHLDIEALSQRLGMPLVPTVARTDEGIEALLDTIVSPLSVPDGNGEEASFPAIARLLSGIYDKRRSPAERRTTIIDRFAAATWLAYPLFFVLLWLIFWLTFTVGQYPMDWIDTAVDWIGAGINSLPLTGAWWEHLRALLTDGILGGVGSVIVFFPNILILYLLLTMLEDSGYLSRAALLADPVLSRFGLHGKSFIPMLMGFGCNVPAVMATRTIETGKSRLITLLVLPLMSCSARIPVYTAFAGAFFMRHASLVMLALYALGIVTAIFVSALLNRTIMRGHGSHFVMELPPYRLPDWGSVWTHSWEKGLQYLRKMGGIIMLASIVIWALNYIKVAPPSDASPTAERIENSGYTANAERIETSGYAANAGNAENSERAENRGYTANAGNAENSERAENSGRTATDERSEAAPPEVSLMQLLGQAMEPVIAPLGFDWRMGVGILAGVGAKELMVSTLGVLYGAGETEKQSETRLQAAIAANTTPSAALAYMVFALLYFPCIATLAAIHKETGHWHHAAFVAAYTTLLAWLVAFAVAQIF